MWWPRKGGEAMSDKEITSRHKVESPAQPDTKPGPVFMPAVDIYESVDSLTVLADMPGVEPGHVSIDLEDSVLTLSAEVSHPSQVAGRRLISEYEAGRFHRQFRLGSVIDQAKIEARMKDGVLTLVLPKVSQAKPRKVAVQAA